MTFLKEHKDGTLLSVHAQPRASRNAVVGTHGGALKIAVHAPPVDSAANEAIQKLLADVFGLPKSHVRLRTGETSRKKTFLLLGLSTADARAKLEGKIK